MSLRHSVALFNEFFFWVWWLIDPDLLWQQMRPGRLTDETFWMKLIGGIENALAVFMDCRCEAIVDHGGSHHADPRVTMVLVVPGEEGLAKSAAILNATKAIWKGRPEFHRSKQIGRAHV